MRLLISTFKIPKMDCPSEEQMIRMKLDDISQIKELNFDIPNRNLGVVHTGEVSVFELPILELNLGATLTGTEEFKGELKEDQGKSESKMLWWVLIINFGFFVLEMLYGVFSKSMGLVADSLDMLADALVYGLSLLAVGSTVLKKKKVAKLSGYFQMVLAFAGVIEITRRFVGMETLPMFQNMIVISLLALIANSLSLYLIQQVKSEEAHMKASAIFTSNDIVINAGVMLAGGLVYLTESRYPDLIIGLIIFVIVFRGALRILKLSK